MRREIPEKVLCPKCRNYSYVIWTQWGVCLSYEDHSDSSNPHGRCVNSSGVVLPEAVLEDGQSVGVYFFSRA